MSHELTNLLPPSSSASFRHMYFIRLGTLAVLLVAGIVIVHGILLLPSYIYLDQEVRAKNLELDRLTTKLKTSEEQQAQAERQDLQTESAELLTLDTTATASSVLQSILAVPRAGIAVTGLTYAPAGKKGSGSLQIVGTASTREALRNYDQALGTLPFVTSANLPISDYAASTKIPFTITVMGLFDSITEPST